MPMFYFILKNDLCAGQISDNFSLILKSGIRIVLVPIYGEPIV